MINSILNWLHAKRLTAVVLIVVFCALTIGLNVPLPGLPPRLLDIFNEVAEAYPLLWLRYDSWLAVVLLLEGLRLFFPALLPTRLQEQGHVNPFSSLVIGLVFVWACYLNFDTLSNIARWSAIEEIDFSELDRIVVWVSSLGGLAALVFLGRVLNQAFPGIGFWLIMAFDNLRWISSQWIKLPEALKIGSVPLGHVSWCFTLSSLCVVMLVVLLRFRRAEGEAGFTSLLWPILAASLFSDMVMRVSADLAPPSLVQSQDGLWLFVDYGVYSTIAALMLVRQTREDRLATSRAFTLAVFFVLQLIGLILAFQDYPVVLPAPDSLVILASAFAVWALHAWRGVAQDQSIAALSLRRE